MVDTINIAIAFSPKLKMDFDLSFTRVVFMVSLNEEKSLRVPFRNRRLYILFGLSAILFVFLLSKLKEGENVQGLAFPGNIRRLEVRQHIVPDAASPAYDLSRPAASILDLILTFGRQIVAVSFHSDLF